MMCPAPCETCRWEQQRKRRTPSAHVARPKHAPATVRGVARSSRPRFHSALRAMQTCPQLVLPQRQPAVDCATGAAPPIGAGFWYKKKHLRWSDRCPLLGVKRTCLGHGGMSPNDDRKIKGRGCLAARSAKTLEQSERRRRASGASSHHTYVIIFATRHMRMSGE